MRRICKNVGLSERGQRSLRRFPLAPFEISGMAAALIGHAAIKLD